jgi:hypothetical protein
MKHCPVLPAKEFGPGTLHSFWTPFTKTGLKPRHQIRDLPAFKGFKLTGDEVVGVRRGLPPSFVRIDGDVRVHVMDGPWAR